MFPSHLLPPSLLRAGRGGELSWQTSRQRFKLWAELDYWTCYFCLQWYHNTAIWRSAHMTAARLHPRVRHTQVGEATTAHLTWCSPLHLRWGADVMLSLQQSRSFSWCRQNCSHPPRRSFHLRHLQEAKCGNYFNSWPEFMRRIRNSTKRKHVRDDRRITTRRDVSWVAKFRLSQDVAGWIPMWWFWAQFHSTFTFSWDTESDPSQSSCWCVIMSICRF